VAVSPPVIVADEELVTFSEKSKDVGGGIELTMRVIVDVCVTPPPVPLIVSG
jgi:hypothetical protein